MTTKPKFPHDYCVRSGVYSTQTKTLEMKLNDYGEYTPLVTDYCQEIELLDAMSNTEHNEDTISKALFSEINNIKHEPIIGYYSDLYAGYVAEGDYRKNSSSGGMGTWIFKELFERKLIDGVIHVKESNDGDGILFKYAVSQSVEEIQAGAKTKYYPAELSQVLKHIRETPGKYAVIGIPSIIMELRLLTIYDPIIKERIIYTIGLICGHQKTTKYAESLAWECGISPENLTGIDFRKKIENSPADLYSVEVR